MTPQNALTHLVETTKAAVLSYAQNPAVQEALKAPLEDWTPAADVLSHRIEEFRLLTFGLGHTLSQVPGSVSHYAGPLLSVVAALSAALQSEKDPIRALTLLEMWLNQTLYDLSPEWYAHLTAETPLSPEQGKALEQSLSPLEVMAFIAVCDTKNRVFEVLYSREWDSEEVMQSWVEEMPFEHPHGLKA